MAKILLVDDEPTYCQHLELLLASVGHSVRTASNGEAAIRVGFEFAPDLVITDWALRDCYSGGEIAASLRRMNPSLRAVLISGDPEITCLSTGHAWAIDEIISKPFNRARILAAVEQLLPSVPKFADAV